jgi:hypothetical protein
MIQEEWLDDSVCGMEVDTSREEGNNSGEGVGHLWKTGGEHEQCQRCVKVFFRLFRFAERCLGMRIDEQFHGNIEYVQMHVG